MHRAVARARAVPRRRSLRGAAPPALQAAVAPLTEGWRAPPQKSPQKGEMELMTTTARFRVIDSPCDVLASPLPPLGRARRPAAARATPAALDEGSRGSAGQAASVCS